MNIAVIGAGAMGGLFAARLAETGQAVSLVEVSPRLIDAITDKGLRLEGHLGPWSVSGPALHIALEALADREWRQDMQQTLRWQAARLDAVAGSLVADQADVRVVDEGVEDADGIGPTTDTRGDGVGESAVIVQHLRAPPCR